ncbi:MAG: hypothetical protein RJQ10_12740 [Haliea sp.]|uniref:hypothetical protein n=1 Tax=Haliea sp. TaxID=1932666 RepID=UPI0032EB248B
MNTENNTFDPGTLCSRKLWRIVAGEENNQALDERSLRKAVAELAERRHYLADLERLGKLERRH